MSNALEQASLIMVPSGYEDGTLGSLKPTDGSGDFTFSRGSNLSATRIGEDGYIKKGYENLLLQSNSFDAGTIYWDLRFIDSVTGGHEGYDGTNDAWKLNRSAGGQYIRSGTSNVSSIGGVQTCSIYAKANEVEWIVFGFNAIGLKYFHLSGDGSLGNNINSVLSASIESVGNGWYRCSFTGNGNGGSIVLYPANGNGDFSGTGGVYIQDAMLNQGLVAYPYLETTTAPVAGGILEDEPRIDFSDGCGHLLLEPSRSNALPNSEYLQGGNGLSISNITIDHNNATSPEGLQNAMKAKVNNGVFNTRIFINTKGSGSQVVSVFAKAGEKNAISVAGYTGTKYLYAAYNLTNGTLMSSDADNHGIEDYGNGWYRVWVYVASSTNRYAHISIGDSADTPAYAFTTTGNGSDGLYLYGWQAELDATYPTSYIPTYGSSATRLADDMDLNPSAAWDSTGSWTIFLELERMNDDSVSLQDIIVFIGTQGSLYIKDRSTKIQIQSLPSYQQGFLGDTYRGDIFKIAIKFDGTRTYGFFNGTKAVISEGNNPQLGYNFIELRECRNHIKHQEVYFPTALSDNECIELTTI